ncbi:MAG: hypothetical protein ABI647_10970 [Gemmatimonadota bacterium]
MGLLIVFTLSGAASRFDNRRKLIVDTSSAMEAASARLGHLAADGRPDLQTRFQQYMNPTRHRVV